MLNSIMYTKPVFSFDWQGLTEQTCKLFNLTIQEVERLAQSPAAKLLAALPFYAECKNPEQLALLKLSMFITGLRMPEIFNHKDNQTVRERILPGVICPDGKPEVIELVTDMLELLSVKDHITDFEADMESGHPNPLQIEIIFYLGRKTILENKIKNYSDCALRTELVRIADPFNCGFWA
jgi:hypothetical protein